MERDRETAAAAAGMDTEWPRPAEGIAVTLLLITRDVERSRRFYTDVLEARVLMEGPPSILRFYNTWLVLSTEGGPTDDKPDVTAAAPSDANTLSTALNLRVADINAICERWRARRGVSHAAQRPRE
jgi:catechol 2,3-dioxygenase-like lactoylglutathione lyase family enzyme